ncbi:MAG: alpha/beta hydrolase [Ramlibacter sp.]|nr:alpha/beta hydrolase [Ramlibacter sp.]
MDPLPPPDGASSVARRTGLLAALTALISGCSATGALNALVPEQTYAGQEGLRYGPGERDRLDVYRPRAAPAGSRPPLVVFFYGGNWKSGDRGDYRFVGEALASGGAIAVIPDYRLVPEVRYPEFLNDNARAVAWVFDHAAQLGGDPDHIYLMGHSAGAYNAAMLAMDPRWLGARRGRLKGLIGIAGPYDFLPIGNPDTQRAFNWPDTRPESQPITYAGHPVPRTLLLAAASDSLVDPQRNTLGLARALKAGGTDVTAGVLDRVSHTTVIAAMARPLRFLAPVRAQVLAFLGLPVASNK